MESNLYRFIPIYDQVKSVRSSTNDLWKIFTPWNHKIDECKNKMNKKEPKKTSLFSRNEVKCGEKKSNAEKMKTFTIKYNTIEKIERERERQWTFEQKLNEMCLSQLQTSKVKVNRSIDHCMKKSS